MNTQDISQAKNPDLRSSLTALRRAADFARRIAIQTETNLVVVREGQTLLIDAKTLREQAQGQNAPAS